MQDFSSPLHLSDSDFIAITRNGDLARPNGTLGPEEFELVMREQLWLFTQTRLSTSSDAWLLDNPGFTLVGAVKQILADQAQLQRDMEGLREGLREGLQGLLQH